MADVHDKATRSFNMSQIKGKDTKPELIVRKFLFSHGFRYRLHVKNLPGKPDIVLPKYRTFIFVNGCFWHGHTNCRYFVVPKTNTEWWLNKINTNKIKDKNNLVVLKKERWKCIILYECQLKPIKRENTLHRLIDKLID